MDVAGELQHARFSFFAPNGPITHGPRLLHKSPSNPKPSTEGAYQNTKRQEKAENPRSRVPFKSNQVALASLWPSFQGFPGHPVPSISSYFSRGHVLFFFFYLFFLHRFLPLFSLPFFLPLPFPDPRAPYILYIFFPRFSRYSLILAAARPVRGKTAPTVPENPLHRLQIIWKCRQKMWESSPLYTPRGEVFPSFCP